MHAGDVRSIDDEALTRAGKNVVRGGRRRRGRRRERAEPDVEAEEGVEAAPTWVTDGSVRVLVCELPKAGGRWHQAHFNRVVIDEFFQIRPNSSQRVFLTGVRTNGSRLDVTARPCVFSSSNKNLKIELGIHRRSAYPTGPDRPLGVFAERQVRVFDYMLLMPGERGYAKAQALLASYDSVGKGLRRILVSAVELAAAWPACPLLTPPPEE